ncbi:hypothetical protein L3X38_036288 [Prunus dulcis]|uniref:SHSP domain-containing protein n=1 Tax=Prunus dulcis TaxID=3755 RepID=A0AAD4YPC0_PRUDU|nr:hypothetical protein L3X38_036288 [Prunus dulcis]
MDTNSNYYDYFEPFCKWQSGETSNTLRVHLQGFQRDQINVMVKFGKILIEGEREYVLEGTSATRWKRFSKEIPLEGRECKLCNMKAKFEAGVLSIILPKKVHKADQLGLSKLVSTLNVTRTTVEVMLAVSMGLAVGAYGTYKLIFPN